VLERLTVADVPCGRIYTAKDIAEDEHYRARSVIETVQSADGLQVEVPGIIPKLSENPGAIHSRGPLLGEHTDEVLAAAGLTPDEVASLKAKGVIA
jgi:formyl-CoA transferase